MQQVKEFKGEFEIQNKPETRRTGQLKIAENGSWRLDITGAFSEGDNIYEPTIIGVIDDSKIVSLLKPSYRSKSSVMTRGQSALSGSHAIIGNRAIAVISELKIREIRFVLSDSDVWFCEDHSYASQQYVSSMYYEKEFKYDQNTNIKIESSYDIWNEGRRVTEVTISSTKSYELSYFQDAIYQLVTFISFAIAKAVKQGHITAIDEQDDEYSIYYQPAFYPVESSVGTNPVLFFHHFPKLQQVFDRWGTIIQSDDLEIPIHLYFVPFRNKMDQIVKYVIRSQTLECLHAKLNRTGRDTFINRVREVLNHSAYFEQFGSKLAQDEIEKLCELIRNSRNYYVHYDHGKEIAQGSDLVFLCMRVEVLIDLLLLQHLGFEKKDFDKIADVVIADRFNRQKTMAKYK